MKKVKVVTIRKRKVYFVSSILFLSVLLFIPLCIYLSNLQINTFADPKSGIIVIDPGHGGIDGGTCRGGILEKDVNLIVSKKLEAHLEQKGYQVVMTRTEDVALDNLDHSGKSRHQRDLNARVHIINGSNAQLFLSIHVNCNLKRPATNGAIVFFSDTFEENKVLAYDIQRSLNAIAVNGVQRTAHDPQSAKYFLLRYSKIPGVIVETGFISNNVERKLLTSDDFRDQLASSIADGVERYLKQSSKTSSSTIEG